MNIDCLYYFDTNAMIKFYSGQNGTLYLRRLVSTCIITPMVSNLTLLELIGVLARFYRKKTIKKHQLLKAVKQIKRDCKYNKPNSKFNVSYIEPIDYFTAQSILLESGTVNSIQTNDALHLAFAIRIKKKVSQDTCMVTSDGPLILSSQKHNITILNPDIVE